MPRVSVIMTVYNAEEHLRESLDDILAQTLEDFEFICVDDGSTDGSGVILRQYAERDRRIRVLEQANGGPSAARNAGLDSATGEYVLLLDCDDRFEPTLLEEAYARCREDLADIAVFRIRYDYVEAGASIEAGWSLRMDLLPEHLPFDRRDMAGRLFRFTTPHVWNKLFKRSFILEKNLRFSTELRGAEDLPFTYLALITAGRITVIDKALVGYRKRLTGSFQERLRIDPEEICRTLALLERQTEEAGVFDEVAPDLIGAALYQCLFTLESVATLEAYRTFYNALRDRYFAELRIDEYAQPGVFDADEYARYLKIKSASVETYLFDEAKTVRGDMVVRAAEAAARQAALLNDLGARKAEIASLRADLADRVSELESLKGDLAAVTDEMAHLNERLADADKKTKATEAALIKTQDRLLKVQQSRSYKMARRMASIASRIRHPLPASRKAD